MGKVQSAPTERRTLLVVASRKELSAENKQKKKKMTKGKKGVLNN